MRIDRLDLIRYGKFTNHSVYLPAAERDFHVVVGANEAGKSTFRWAIQDLLYGIPRNTPHGFKHAMNELRLGGLITHAADSLEFQRCKANTKTLRSLADAVLPDGTLGAFLGTTDRDFFAKMFGLDHGRLVDGGYSLLKASDDLGQILFQSAAGIGSLGVIREALDAEADKLWAKRKSSDRAYYIAAHDLENAVAALKEATVRTKDWALAHAKVTELEEAEAKAKVGHAAIKVRLSLLERVRRVAHHLNELDMVSSQHKVLGSIAELPESAARTLIDAEKAEAAAKAELRHYRQLEEAAQAALAGLHVDRTLLACEVEVAELNDRRLQYRTHESDMKLRQAEVDAQWRNVASLAEQLGWDVTSEEAVKSLLPKLATRTALEGLIRTHATLRQGLEAAQRAQRTKAAEIEQTSKALAGLSVFDVPSGLQAALQQVQKLGDFTEMSQFRQEMVNKKARDAEAAYVALGPWRAEPSTLAAMAAPAPDVIKSFSQEQLAGEAEAKAARAQHQGLARQVEQLELEIEQFRQAHHPVTREEVQQAREAREVLWTSILVGNPTGLAAQRAEYSRLVTQADALADARHDKVQQASELQTKQQQLERVKADASTASTSVQSLIDASDARAARWADLGRECGLPGLSFQATLPWLEARKKALEASQALAEAINSFDTHEAACAKARAALAKELTALGQGVADESLPTLMLRADDQVRGVSEAQGQRKTLARQKSDAEQALILLQESVASATSDMQAWEANWGKALAQAGLAQNDVDTVDNVLKVAAQMKKGLDSMQQTQVDRLDTMQADLARQGEVAHALALRLAPELAKEPATTIALELLSRLNAAKDASGEITRQTQALALAQEKANEAEAGIQQAKAQLVPFFERTGTTSNAELAEAIADSDKRRRLVEAAARAEKAVQVNADSLTLEQLRVETASVDATALLVELGELAVQDEQLVNQRSTLAAQKQSATQALDLIAGSAQAARAEGQRQEALAKMEEAASRYIRVYAAARLLKWSIEQYREEKQGPMLARAGSIFQRLTRGSFEKLNVDFDSEPLKLQAKRADETLVDIDGLSEGTRDQLFLALRLAALDMHLDQAHALPFIADDLFINYDDARSKEGLEALGELSRKTQVVFLTHHDHLLPTVRHVFGAEVNIVSLAS
jgi:uncharacterized protein YhaN